MGTLANSEDYTVFFENYNLTSLDMYDGLSPVNESNVVMDDIAFHKNRFIDCLHGVITV